MATITTTTETVEINDDPWNPAAATTTKTVEVITYTGTITDITYDAPTLRSGPRGATLDGEQTFERIPNLDGYSIGQTVTVRERIDSGHTSRSITIACPDCGADKPAPGYPCKACF